MNLIKKLTAALICGFISVAVIAGQTHASHIDYLVDGGYFSHTDHLAGLDSVALAGDAGNILGSEREVTLDFISGTGFVSSGTLGASAGPGPVGPDSTKVLQLSNSVTSLAKFTITYDGVGSAGLGGVDLDTAWDEIVVEFVAVQGAGELTLTLDDTAAGTGSSTKTVSSGGSVAFSFADAGFAGVDKASLDSIKLTLDTMEAASDFSIASVTLATVPEPNSALLAVSGLLLLALRLRRKV